MLPSNIAKARDMLTLTAEGSLRSETHEYSGMYSSLGIDNSFKYKDFQKNLKIQVHNLSHNQITFDLIGVDAAIANTFRRIMIAQVPTIAIEHVLISQNTGVLHDEVIAHRLGLLPMAINPDLLDYATSADDLTSENSVCLRLHVKGGSTGATVYSKDLKWAPRTDAEKAKWHGQPIPACVLPDILITKLDKFQELDIQVICVKGIGKSHAKWSPTCTAFYRMLPFIEYPEGPIKGAMAEELRDICPKNVFDVEDGVSVVAAPRDCSSCRACFEKFPNKVEVNKLKNHFIFSVESTGSIPAKKIVQDSFRLLAGMAEEVMTLIPQTQESQE